MKLDNRSYYVGAIVGVIAAHLLAAVHIGFLIFK